jgi:hypothetical protein
MIALWASVTTPAIVAASNKASNCFKHSSFFAEKRVEFISLRVKIRLSDKNN